MTRSDLIAVLASRCSGLTEKDAEVAVKEILHAIGQALARGKRVEIRGFGSFELKFHPARTGRNPKNGEKVLVPPKCMPHFHAGKDLRERVEQSAKAEQISKAA